MNEVACNGVKKLQTLVSELSHEKQKVRQRDENIRIIEQLYLQHRSILFDGSCADIFSLNDFVQGLFNEALKELTDNETKSKKKSGNPKTMSFDLFLRVSQQFCDDTSVGLIDENQIPLVSMYLKLLDHPFLQSENWMQVAVSESFARYLSVSELDKLDEIQLRSIWKRMWCQLPMVVNKPYESGAVILRIILQLLRAFHNTILSLNGRPVIIEAINKLFGSLEGVNVQNWSKSVYKALVEVLCCLLDVWGIDCRQDIFSHIWPLAMNLCGGKRLTVDSADSDGVDSLWNFIENLAVLAMPDCNPCGLVDTHMFEVAKVSLHTIVSSLSKMAITRQSFIIPPEKVSLLARLLVIVEFSDFGGDAVPDSSFSISFSQHSKRRKEMTAFETLTQWNEHDLPRNKTADGCSYFTSCLLVLTELVNSWHHRLGLSNLKTLGELMWKQREMLSDIQQGKFCSLIEALICAGAFGRSALAVKAEAVDGQSDPLQDPRVRIRSMWQFAIQTSHVPSSAANSVSLMITILKHFKEVLSEEEKLVDVIVAVVRRVQNRAALPLLSFLLLELEFDETKQFHTAEKADIGMQNWRFRCQLCEWLLSHFAIDLSTILSQLCSYHPQPSNEVDDVVEHQTPESFGLLCNLNVLGFGKPSGQSSNRTESSGEQFCRAPIKEMVEFIAILLQDRMLNDTTLSPYVWQTSIKFLHFINWNILSCDYLSALQQSVNEKFMEAATSGLTDLMDKLDPGIAVDVLSFDTRRYVVQQFSGSPVLCARFHDRNFRIKVGPQIFIDYLDEIKRQMKTKRSDSSWLEAVGYNLEQFSIVADFLPDILHLLKKYGDVIPPKARSDLISKAWSIAEEDGEQQSQLQREFTMLQVAEAVLHQQSSTFPIKVAYFELLDQLPRISCVRNLRNLVLDGSSAIRLLGRCMDSPILAQCVVRHVLGTRGLWNIHFDVIKMIISNKDIFKICEEYVADLVDHIEFHLWNLAAKDITCDSSLLFSRRLAELNVGPDIYLLKQRETMNISCFPGALTLTREYWEDVARSFCHLFGRNPHHLLYCLRLQTQLHCRLGLELRLVSFLQLLASVFVRSNISKPLFSLFTVCVRTAVVTLTESLVKKMSDCNDNLCVFMKSVVEISTFLDEEVKYTFIHMMDALNSMGFDELPEELCSERDALADLANSESCQFLDKGTTKNVSSLSLSAFWNAVEKLLRQSSDCIDLSQCKGSRTYDLLLSTWDIVPHCRRHIASCLRFFTESTVAPIRRSLFTMKGLDQFLYEYCSLTIANHRLSESDLVKYCVHFLSFDICDRYSAPHLSQEKVFYSVSSRRLVQFSKSVLKLVLSSAELSSVIHPGLSLLGDMMQVDEDLCHLLTPYLCHIVESKERVAETLLEFASSLCSESDEDSRVIRTLCECVDGIGLDTFALLEVQPTGFINFGALALRARYFEYSFALANLAFDRVVASERNLLAWGGGDTGKPDNRELNKLLTDIYVSTENAAALDSLPEWAQCDDRVQHLRALALHRWLRVSSDNVSTTKQKVIARWFCGMDMTGGDRESTYLNAILHANWNISYPKRLRTHSEMLYSLLVTIPTSSTELLSRIKELRQVILNDIVTAGNLSSEKWKCLQDFHHLELFFLGEMPPQKLTISQLCVAVMGGFLKATKDASCDFFLNHTELLVGLLNRLLDIEAYPACLSLLTKWTSLYPSNLPTHRLTVEQARVLIAMGDYQVAQHHLNQLRQNGQAVDTQVAAEAMCLLATISSDHDHALDNAIAIMNTLISRLPNATPTRVLVTAYEHLHRLSVRHLFELEAYMQSPTNKTRKEAIVQWTRQLRHPSYTTKEKTKQAVIIRRELLCEQEEWNNLNKRLQEGVSLAIESGLHLLSALSPADITEECSPAVRESSIRVIFPLLDILFRYEEDSATVNLFRKYVSKMVTSIWVPAFPHVVSHCFKASKLSPVIIDMTVKMVAAYPYHVLHTLLAYASRSDKVHKVESILASAVRMSRDSAGLQNVISRMKLAHSIYQKFVHLSVENADYFKPLGNDRYVLLDSVELLKNLSTLKRVPIPTLDQRMGKAGDYSTSSLICWHSIERNCAKADGVSAPKILTVVGTDQKKYKIVWKGGDDIRQDCMVEHLFDIMSGLLDSKCPLRTYRVVPLDSTSGVIEFCSNTISLKDLLVGSGLNGGLHKRINPTENVLKVRNVLLKLFKEGKPCTMDDFLPALKSVTPVFRHHFYKEFSSVHKWSEMIGNYTTSLAEWSIVCYVVGLGDRHASNVLFEENTCNFVHIDLGMVLEHSKRVLPVPEKVPFRMTRDLLDPILIQGIDGKLASVAKTAMDKFKKHKEVILGVASVFLRESMANFRDSLDESRPSFVSATAIDRLRSKLNGTDNTISPVCSDVQVKRLLKEATDMDHLSKIFIGWLSIV